MNLFNHDLDSNQNPQLDSNFNPEFDLNFNPDLDSNGTPEPDDLITRLLICTILLLGSIMIVSSLLNFQK